MEGVGLPPPDSHGRSDDGWDSYIWRRGSEALRLRLRGPDSQWELFRNRKPAWPHPEWGPRDLGILWARAWLSGH